MWTEKEIKRKEKCGKKALKKAAKENGIDDIIAGTKRKLGACVNMNSDDSDDDDEDKEQAQTGLRTISEKVL